ncbi:MAG: hypothetical protein H6Q69_1682 [Firmicutes bacterium]|nr:hypothetical protein [Bacillota bacterium]
MPRYEREHSFYFQIRQYVKMIKNAVKFGVIAQIIMLTLLVLASSFTDLNGEPIESRITAKFFLSYLYPNHPTSDWGWLELDPQLRQYIDYADPIIQEYAAAEKVQNLVYRLMADVATDGQYSQFLTYLIWSFYVSLSVPIIYLAVFMYRGSIGTEETFLRGSEMADIKTLNKNLQKFGSGTDGLQIGETIIPKTMETKHVLILGAPGSGKGVLLNQLSAQIRARKEKMVFYDVKGEFVSKQSQPDDVIFSPFDERFPGWSFFNEFSTEPELDVLTKSLFAVEHDKNAYFYDSAATIFRSGILCLAAQNATTNADIWDFFTKNPGEIAAEIKKLPAENHEALKFLTGADETVTSIMTTLANRIEFMKYLRGLDGGFSLKNWVTAGQQNIFLLNVEEFSKIFRPLMSMAIEILARGVLSLPDAENRRIFFVLDELGTLNRLDSLLQLITVGRSKGAGVILASQDMGRIEDKYGRPNTKTFVNNCNTNVFFRLTEPETTKYVSSILGQRQLKRRNQSHTLNARESDNQGISEQNTTEDLVMPAELVNLPDLTAYCRIANVGIAKITLPKKFYPVIAEPFIQRQFTSIFTNQSVETEATKPTELVPPSPPEPSNPPNPPNPEPPATPTVKFMKM